MQIEWPGFGEQRWQVLGERPSPGCALALPELDGGLDSVLDLAAGDEKPEGLVGCLEGDHVGGHIVELDGDPVEGPGLAVGEELAEVGGAVADQPIGKAPGQAPAATPIAVAAAAGVGGIPSNATPP